MKKLLMVLAISLWAMTHAWSAPADIGIVLMHGKGSGPRFPGLTVVADAMAGKGYQVASILMPWSRNRQYDKDYTEALAQIDDTVAGLKVKGVKHIFIAGHSFGANASLAYASRRDGVTGIMLLAPGHSPDTQASFFSASVSKAKSMIDEGKAEELADFYDSNQGKTSTIKTKARVYFSYFDPNGLGAMSLTAAKVRPGTAVLLIIGNSDPWAGRARSVIFDKTPADARSRYVEIVSNHLDTPRDGIEPLLSWLKTFE